MLYSILTSENISNTKRMMNIIKIENNYDYVRIRYMQLDKTITFWNIVELSIGDILKWKINKYVKNIMKLLTFCIKKAYYKYNKIA